LAPLTLFSRLQRLFSTDVVIRNQGGNQLKVIDADRIQTSGEYETNALMNRFKGIYQNPASTSLYGANFNLNYQYLRTQLYSDYDGMDTEMIWVKYFKLEVLMMMYKKFFITYFTMY